MIRNWRRREKLGTPLKWRKRGREYVCVCTHQHIKYASLTRCFTRRWACLHVIRFHSALRHSFGLSYFRNLETHANYLRPYRYRGFCPSLPHNEASFASVVKDTTVLSLEVVFNI